MLRFGVNLIKYEVVLLNLQFAERSYRLRRANQLAQLDYGQITEELDQEANARVNHYFDDNLELDSNITSALNTNTKDAPLIKVFEIIQEHDSRC